MISFGELNLGFSDAENYKKRENKELFNRIFVRTEDLDRLCNSNTYFLIGDKGTGKTAYAVFMANNYHREHYSAIRYLRETEYQKFVMLKRQKHLELSDYTSIWKTIIYLLLSQEIVKRNKDAGWISRFTKFKNLQKAIDEFYVNAFTPEIMYALSFLENAEKAAELILKNLKIGGKKSKEVSFSKQMYQTNLLYILRNFEEALSSLKLESNFLLLIDGIDIRPDKIEYRDYLECVKGLANAVWSANSDFFANIKDSKGRMRCVVLLRPDIFNSLGLQNQNSKLRDNSVLLDWRTTYSEHRSSKLFKMADHLLSSQHDLELAHGEAWDHYFPFKSTVSHPDRAPDPSFISFLRFSYYRPRDIVTMLKLLQDGFVQYGRPQDAVLWKHDFDNPRFRRSYSEYLLGEVKDQLSFYYTTLDYEMLLKFFQYLDGRYRFTYTQYLNAYTQWETFLKKNNITKLGFAGTPDDLLEFLFNLNVLCYIEQHDGQSYIRWCFRERTLSNISPKVKVGLTYEIHYGLGKALNLGKRHTK